MDIYCPKCGEPWDNDSLHEAAAELNEEARSLGERPVTYDTVARDFRDRGCLALGERCGKPNPEIAKAAAAVYAFSGDDMDGAASDFEDFAARHFSFFAVKAHRTAPARSHRRRRKPDPEQGVLLWPPPTPNPERTRTM